MNPNPPIASAVLGGLEQRMGRPLGQIIDEILTPSDPVPPHYLILSHAFMSGCVGTFVTTIGGVHPFAAFVFCSTQALSWHLFNDLTPNAVTPLPESQRAQENRIEVSRGNFLRHIALPYSARIFLSYLPSIGIAAVVATIARYAFADLALSVTSIVVLSTSTVFLHIITFLALGALGVILLRSPNI